MNFEKIVNNEGLTINNDAEQITISVIPELKVLSSVPREGAYNASLTDLYVCTNLPLVNPADEDIDEYFSANNYYNFKYWSATRRVPKSGPITGYKCGHGEFQNNVGYGLVPNTDYEIKLRIEDQFSSYLNQTLSFRTGEIPDYYLNFYHMQKTVLLTTPDKTRLTFATENFEYVDMDICKLPAESMMKYVLDKPKFSEGPDIINDCVERKNVRVDLEPRYWVKNYFQIELKDYIDNPFGHYLFTFSNPKYTTQYSQNNLKVHERVYLSISNLGVIEKKIDVGTIENIDPGEGIENLFWVTGLKTMDAVESAKISMYDRERRENSDVYDIKLKNTVYTDKNGIAKTEAAGYSDALLVEKGGDSAILVNQENNLISGSTANSAKKIYLYTDRPIYRPGHEVNIKGIYRIGYDNDYEIFRDKNIEITIQDSRRDEIEKKELAVSDFGTFSTSLSLAEDAPLGTYYIQTDGGMASFEVEEYAPAAFKVDLASEQEEYVSGDTMNIKIDASYYFGAPVEEAEVEYSIGSQDYHFDRYDDGSFRFGTEWYYCWWGCSYNDKFVLRNKTRLDREGKGTITHLLDLQKLFKDENDIQSKIFVVYATVKNKNGQSVSTQKSFIVHRGDYYLGLKTSSRFLGVNESFDVMAKSVDKEGKELSVKNIELSLDKISWERMKRKQVDGAYYYKWEEVLTSVSKETISTDDKGNFQKTYSVKENGQYRALARGEDSKGNTVSATYDIYVYGSGRSSIKPSNDQKLEIEASASELNVGEAGEIIIKNPFKKAKVLVSLERGRIFEYKIFDVNESLFNYKFNIKEEYIPNVYVSATLISPEPDIKYGSAQFKINTREKEIDVTIKTNKEHYLPGEEVELTINASDHKNRPVEAEFSVAVADLSVLALKGNPKKNPLVFFYGGFPLTVTTASNYKNILYQMEVLTGAKGGGGAEAEDLATKKRGIFKDTALWQGMVRTDSSGQASLAFTLPDNLTTWQVEALGVSKDTKLGVEYSEFIARKDLMLIPLEPRFIVPGDEFSLGAKIFNQTGGQLELDIKFVPGSLEVIGETGTAIVIPAKENDIVYFRAKAPENIEEGGYTYALSASNKDYNDTVEKYLKIRPNDTYETTATAGYTKNESTNEYLYLPENIMPNKGGLTINTSATLAVFLSNALNSLIKYPYGCSEQIASKLDAIAIIKKGLNLENVGDKFNLEKVIYNDREYTIDELVDIGLKEMYKTQSSSGGFKYYPDSRYENFYLSLHIADTLYSLEQAGYRIDKESIKKVYNYLISEVFNDWRYGQNKERYIYTALTLSRLSDYGDLSSRLKEKVREIANNDKYINEDVSSLALADLAMYLSHNREDYPAYVRGKVINNLENRIEIDSRGAFLPSAENWSWYYYETPVKNTAELLRVLIINDRDNQLLDRMLRWLLRSRYKDGAWGSTSNTLRAVDALVDYLIWQEENKSSFKLDVNFDARNLGQFEYGPANIFEQNILNLEMKEFTSDKLYKVNFNKTNLNNLNNNLYYDLALKYYLPAYAIPPRDEGFVIERNFYKISDQEYKEPVLSATIGDVLKAHINLKAPKARHFVSIEDFIPAGVELINFNLDTENVSAVVDYSSEESEIPNLSAKDRYRYSNWYLNWEKERKLYPDISESHDDRLFLFIEDLQPGEYEYDYYVRVLVPGKFQWLPARAQEMYFPENFGRTGGRMFVVNEKE